MVQGRSIWRDTRDNLDLSQRELKESSASIYYAGTGPGKYREDSCGAGNSEEPIRL